MDSGGKRGNGGITDGESQNRYTVYHGDNDGFLSALTVSGILKKNVKADRQSEISDSEKKDAEEGEQDGSQSTD